MAILEARPLVGGVWSSTANSSSQVNSSEGGYCFKDLLEDDHDPAATNRDHSPTSEILRDIHKLAALVGHGRIYCSVAVAKVLDQGKGGHVVLATAVGSACMVQARGVVVCCNDPWILAGSCPDQCRARSLPLFACALQELELALRRRPCCT